MSATAEQEEDTRTPSEQTVSVKRSWNYTWTAPFQCFAPVLQSIAFTVGNAFGATSAAKPGDGDPTNPQDPYDAFRWHNDAMVEEQDFRISKPHERVGLMAHNYDDEEGEGRYGSDDDDEYDYERDDCSDDEQQQQETRIESSMYNNHDHRQNHQHHLGNGKQHDHGNHHQHTHGKQHQYSHGNHQQDSKRIFSVQPHRVLDEHTLLTSEEAESLNRYQTQEYKQVLEDSNLPLLRKSALQPDPRQQRGTFLQLNVPVVPEDVSSEFGDFVQPVESSSAPHTEPPSQQQQHQEPLPPSPQQQQSSAPLLDALSVVEMKRGEEQNIPKQQEQHQPIAQTVTAVQGLITPAAPLPLQLSEITVQPHMENAQTVDNPIKVLAPVTQQQQEELEDAELENALANHVNSYEEEEEDGGYNFETGVTTAD